jgi:hypothetical protein
MKARLGKLLWTSAVVLVVVGVICAVSLSHRDSTAQKAMEETRQALRQQGFKTDLADFDFSTSAELRAREAILKATVPDRRSEPFVNHPNLMEAVGMNSAIVVWKQNSLKRQYPSGPGNNYELNWNEFRDAINEHQPELDAACNAALSGPIRFNLNARGGNAMLLPHLAMLKNLTQTFDSRAMLDLHDGNKDAAWTNLLAATRLVTAWEPEPAEVSQLVRFSIAGLAYNATWQLLQTNGWPDEQLAHLQQEWESVDFFKNLPETAAFKRASTTAECQWERMEQSELKKQWDRKEGRTGQRERREPSMPGIPFTEFFKEALQFPPSVWIQLNERWRRVNYRKHGSYDDEKALLLFYRDRELEIRSAVQAPTWAQMRQLPGVTNRVFFYSKYRSRLQSIMNLREMNTAFLKRGSGFLGRAAEAEARRRILVTAIALERYRGKYNSYPKTLGDLAPEFLKTVPVDFMDGQPLRYRLTDDGHFVLYSVGLDCVDNGGIIQTREQRIRANWEADPFGVSPEADLIWPRPVSSAEAVAQQK